MHMLWSILTDQIRLHWMHDLAALSLSLFDDLSIYTTFLNSLHCSLSILTIAGELLDQIEHQVKAAADYIDDGNANVIQAMEIQKSIRKKQCCIIMIVSVIIVIVIIIIVLTTGVKGGLRRLNVRVRGDASD